MMYLTGAYNMGTHTWEWLFVEGKTRMDAINRYSKWFSESYAKPPVCVECYEKDEVLKLGLDDEYEDADAHQPLLGVLTK